MFYIILIMFHIILIMFFLISFRLLSFLFHFFYLSHYIEKIYNNLYTKLTSK